MADADSLQDMSSDLDQDQSADDGDVEDDLVNEESAEAASRKKSKKKIKRRTKDMERSSGDSDSQAVLDEQELKIRIIEGLTETLQSGAEADSESQVHDHSKCTSDHNHAEHDVNDLSEVSLNQLKQMQQKAAGIQSIQRAVELLSIRDSAKTIQDAKKKTFQFWRTQPVPKLDEDVEGNEHIEPDKSSTEVRDEPYTLPTGFKWNTLDIQDPIILKELYTLLNENYVEDDDNMFRFDYSSEFLRWALMPPGWLTNWHCGIRVIKSEKLVGFISAVPAHVKIYERTKKMVEINFLCVHKKLRSKRMAPVLIKEITRRVHKEGLFQAVYTAGVVLPKPVAVCRYWHRSLNPRKLIDIKFSHLSRNMTMQRTLKLYKLPDSPRTPGFRPYKPSDLKQAHQLLSTYLGKFDLSAVFSVDDFEYWFTPRQGIIDSYVVERNGKLTDFVSFYTLSSSVMHHPTHKNLKAAYSFYNVSLGTEWKDLILDTLIVAKSMEFDVFNALDLMENKKFLEDLKFGMGDGNLQYYLYNWKCPQMDTSQVGLVLQ